MKRTKKPHPLSGTVSRFISKGRQRWLRQKRFEEQQGHNNPIISKSKTPKQKKVKESNFVRFMNKLEHKGPERLGSQHETWTINIHEIMTRRGTWPTGMDEWNVEILAEYLQELQRQFWNSLYPVLKKKLLPFFCSCYPTGFMNEIPSVLSEHRVAHSKRNQIVESARNSLRTFNWIHKIIRQRGLRDKSFITSRGNRNIRLTRIFIDKYPVDQEVRVRVWRHEDCVLGSYYGKKEITPILVMPHNWQRIDVSCRSNVRHRFQHLQVDETVFVF